MDLSAIGPLFETGIHAGLFLRIFQAFARSIQAPKADARGFYRFFYALIQNLADNKDRMTETRPATTLP